MEGVQTAATAALLTRGYPATWEATMTLQKIGNFFRRVREAELKPIEVPVIDVPWRSSSYTEEQVSEFRDAVDMRRKEIPKLAARSH